MKIESVETLTTFPFGTEEWDAIHSLAKVGDTVDIRSETFVLTEITKKGGNEIWRIKKLRWWHRLGAWLKRWVAKYWK